MQRKQDGLVPIGDAWAELDGPVNAGSALRAPSYFRVPRADIPGPSRLSHPVQVPSQRYPRRTSFLAIFSHQTLNTLLTCFALHMRPRALFHLVPGESLAQLVRDGVALAVRRPKNVVPAKFLREFAGQFYGQA